MGIRNKHNWITQTTDLILHHSITNISNYTTEFVCILGIVQETLNVPLLGQELKSLENVLQFSTNHCLPGVNVDLGMCEPTFPVASSSFLPSHCLEEQVCRVKQRGP